MRRAGQRLRIEDAVSAGGIVYRRAEGGIEVVLCGRMPQGIWGLPKGTPIPGETLEQTALREVREETGVEVAITGFAGVISYTFIERGVRYRKRVAYYTMVAIGGDPSLHDHEYDYVRWFALDEALRAMRYPNEADLVRRTVGMASLSVSEPG